VNRYKNQMPVGLFDNDRNQRQVSVINLITRHLLLFIDVYVFFVKVKHPR